MREAEPVLGDDGQPVTVKLHPEPKETRFPPKQAVAPPGDAPQEDGAAPAPEEAPHDGDAKPKRRLVRIRKSLAGKPEAGAADGGEATEPDGGADPALA